jgi:hypothetical protein
MADGGTEIAVSLVALAGSLLVAWMRGRAARSVAALVLAESRERELRDLGEALVADYRRRLAEVRFELEREVRRRRALGRRVRRIERGRFRPLRR